MFSKAYANTFDDLLESSVPMELLFHPNLVYLKWKNENIQTLVLQFFINGGKGIDKDVFQELSGLSKPTANRTFSFAVRNKLIVMNDEEVFELNPRFFGFEEGVELNKHFYDQDGSKLIPIDNVKNYISNKFGRKSQLLSMIEAFDEE